MGDSDKPQPPATFDERFGFPPRPPTGDPSVDEIIPPIPGPPQPIYKEGDIIPTPTPSLDGDPGMSVPPPEDNPKPIDAYAQATPLPTAEPSLPPLPTGDPLSGQNPAYESHGGVDYSGRPSSLADQYARGGVDPRSMTPEQLARVKAEIAANPTIGTGPRPSRRG
jgi:hypothetical protein